MTHWAIVTTGGHWDECHGGRSKDLEKEEERKRLCDEIKWFLETCVYRFMSIYEHVYGVVFFQYIGTLWNVLPSCYFIMSFPFVMSTCE